MNKIYLTKNYKYFKKKIIKSCPRKILKNKKNIKNISLNNYLNKVIPKYKCKYNELSLYNFKNNSSLNSIKKLNQNLEHIKKIKNNRLKMEEKKRIELYEVFRKNYLNLKRKINLKVKKKYLF